MEFRLVPLSTFLQMGYEIEFVFLLREFQKSRISSINFSEQRLRRMSSVGADAPLADEVGGEDLRP